MNTRVLTMLVISLHAVAGLAAGIEEKILETYKAPAFSVLTKPDVQEHVKILSSGHKEATGVIAKGFFLDEQGNIDRHAPCELKLGSTASNGIVMTEPKKYFQDSERGMSLVMLGVRNGWVADSADDYFLVKFLKKEGNNSTIFSSISSLRKHVTEIRIKVSNINTLSKMTVEYDEKQISKGGLWGSGAGAIQSHVTWTCGGFENVGLYK